MDGSTALVCTLLALCALLFAHSRGIKAGRALLEPQLNEKDRINQAMRVELDKIQNDLNAPASTFNPPVRTGDAFTWLGVRMVCTGNQLHTVAGPLDCVRAEYADRDGVVHIASFSGSEIDALRIEMERQREINSRSIFSEFPPSHRPELIS